MSVCSRLRWKACRSATRYLISSFPTRAATPRRLSTLLADGPVALFFYPAAMTGRLHQGGLPLPRSRRRVRRRPASSGSGISMDAVDKQKQFADMHSFDYPLLADTDGTVADIFGVKRGKIGAKLGAPVKRQTFAIGRDRRLVAAIASETNMDKHADEALAALK